MLCLNLILFFCFFKKGAESGVFPVIFAWNQAMVHVTDKEFQTPCYSTIIVMESSRLDIWGRLFSGLS